MMNIHAELQRLWWMNKQARTHCPIEKVFTGGVPDTYVDSEGATKELDPPYVVIWSPDGQSPGGTSLMIDLVDEVQVSCFAGTREKAVAMRDFARDFFEDAILNLVGSSFQDISITSHGELDPRDGVFEVFQRFEVKTAISRPRRKGF